MNTPVCIDIHAHYYPESFIRLMAEQEASSGAVVTRTDDGPLLEVGILRAGPLARKFIDLELRIAEMDAQGVAVQALSLTQPMVYWADRALSEKLAVTFNDALAEAHGRYPERLVGLATLPMQAPDLALAELDRVASLPGIKGIYLATRVLDRELSDPIFFPLYERIEDLGLPIFLHPLEVIGAERLKPYFLFNLLGNPFDTAVAAAQLIFGGVLDRRPLDMRYRATARPIIRGKSRVNTASSNPPGPTTPTMPRTANICHRRHRCRPPECS